MIDLHVHSTYSDGTLTPAALVTMAAENGVMALALTDHDSVDGVPALLAACAARGEGSPAVRGIPGVEISAEVPRGAMHLLGYFMDCRHEALTVALLRLREGREARNRQLLERLGRLGCPLTWDEVAAHAGEDVVGRPHFAQAMVDRGYVPRRERAFTRFLARGQAAYIERERLSPADSIAAIAAAGGVPVLAHPYSLDLTATALRRRLVEWKAMGLQGIEVYYPSHQPDQEATLARMAAELDLVATGGSDFHGAGRPGLRLGHGYGTLQVPDDTVAQLEARRPK